MSGRWYLARSGGEPEGPFTTAELAAQARTGTLTPSDRVWTPEFPEWVDAASVPALYPVAVPDLRPPPLAVLSDALPLVILCGVILCFLVYFGRSLPGLAEMTTMATPAKLVESGRTAATFVAEADGDDVYAVEICNHTKEERLYAAVAYFDPLKNDWVARGWFPEDQGDCIVAIKNLRAPIYVYAETKDGASRWSEERGSREFCIEARSAFALRQNDCGAFTGGKIRRQKFKELRLSGKGGTHTWDLTE